MFSHKLFKTADGSLTLQIPEWNEQYHSKHGALQEALHVFIKEGFLYKTQQGYKRIAILEFGFGTGLNTLLTKIFAEKEQISIDYTAIEAYPVVFDIIEKLNFSEQLKIPSEEYLELHKLSWNTKHKVSEYFSFTKKKMRFEEIDEKEFELIYFDAFGIRVQPELWTANIFKKAYAALTPNGSLVTYAANGKAKRALMEVGFQVEKIPGPPGKREMMRATKI